jgi:hypothetical protein
MVRTVRGGAIPRSVSTGRTIVTGPARGRRSRPKTVPVDSDSIWTCRELGISLGDTPPVE